MKLFGRPIKPVALGAALAMVVISIFNFFNAGRFGDLLVGDFVSIVAVIAFVCLNIGWWKNSQFFAELGLLLASGVYVSRSIFLMLIVGFDDVSTWLSLSTGIILIGAYLLESTDPQSQRQKRNRLWTRQSRKQ